MAEKTYRIGEFARRAGLSVSGARRLDEDGRFPAKRTAAGQRYYTDADVRAYLNLPLSTQAKTVVYCRVSSRKQQGELEHQRQAMETFALARGIAVDEWIDDIGGGLNMRRPKFVDLVYRITQGEINCLVVAHKDRLSRFGFGLVEELAKRAGCEVIVANQESLSPEAEVVEDVLAVLHHFSGRVSGLRNYAKASKGYLEATAAPTDGIE